MDPKLSTDERKMQEEILRHEFPFDEKAWAAMETLLDRKDDKPVAGIPPKTPETLPGPGRKWALLLILLFSFGIGSASLFWWNLNRQTKDSSTGPSTHKSAGKGADSIGVNKIRNLDSNAVSPKTNPKAASAEVKAKRPGGIALSRVKHLPGQKNKDREAYSSRPLIQNPEIKTEHSYRVEHSERVKKMLEQMLSDTILISDRIDPNTIRMHVGAIPPSNPDAIWLESIMELPIRPLNKVVSLDSSLQRDSIIRPLKIQPASIRRLERGWIFGLNANTVDYNPLRLSTLPHLGYFYAYRFRPGTWLQAELVVKYVTGYGLSARFVDIIPGGMTENVLNTNNLLFFEVPLLIKHSYQPDHSWLLGIKPSGNIKLFPGGLSSFTNDGPSRFLSSQDGVRYFDLGLVLGWEWRFRRVWALDVRYNQGLFDLSYDQFYKDRSTHLNSDLQVSLRYFPGKKMRKHAPKTLFPVPGGR